MLLLSFVDSRAQLVSCSGASPQHTAAVFPVYDPHNDDVVINCDMLQADNSGGNIKAIAYGKRANYYALPTPTIAESHVFVEDWMGNNLTINLPTDAVRPDVALADGPGAIFPPQPNELPQYRLVVTYQVGMNAYFDEYRIKDCGAPTMTAAHIRTVKLNKPGFVCDTIYGMPHIDTWTDTKQTNASNGFPYVHKFSVVFTQGTIQSGGPFPWYLVLFPITPASYIYADSLYSYEEDLDVLPTTPPQNWGPNAFNPDVACYFDLRKNEEHIQVAYNSAGGFGNLMYLDLNTTTYPSLKVQTPSATLLDDSCTFPPRIECMNQYDQTASPYQAKYEVVAVRSSLSACPGNPGMVQAFGYNNISPTRTWLSPAHNCDNIKSPCVAAGVGQNYGAGELGNIQYTTGYFPWAGSSVYTRSVDPVTAGVDPHTWEVNCGTITYPWDVSRSFHISNCSNTGYDLLSAWYDGLNVEYKTTANTMLFRQIPEAFTGASSSSNWSISPIPALSQLELRGHAAGQYQIIDVTGRCCAQGQVLENGRLDIGTLASGLYTFQLRTTDGHLQVKKFAKL